MKDTFTPKQLREAVKNQATGTSLVRSSDTNSPFQSSETDNPNRTSDTKPMKTRFVKFGSHRARDYGLRALQRKPQSFFSLQRETGVGGVYEVTEAEIGAMRGYSKHARFTILRSPYHDLHPCWSIT